MMIWRSLDNGLLVKVLRSIIGTQPSPTVKSSAPAPASPPKPQAE